METAKIVWRLLHLPSPSRVPRSVTPVLTPTSSDSNSIDDSSDCMENCIENDVDVMDDSSCCSTKNRSYSYEDSELDIREGDDEGDDESSVWTETELRGIINMSSSSARERIDQTPDFIFATACLSMVSRLNKDFVAVTPRAKARKLLLTESTQSTPQNKARTLTT